ncbi:unnamed protein product [Ceutorhynchus assimilis]|uniref:Eukaryotic translation initiation factor 4E-binding protein Mextli n=1 Tax=Ceutorhynchus assimilis TaxID=467358 RepID=A0A9P0DEL9_9CUCU|nr:unnamed protein product [Ceutorhynchus assimilis]
MSSGMASRLKHPKKHDLVKSHSQAQLLASRLRQEGVMVTVDSVLQAVDQVATLLASNQTQVNYNETITNLCQHLKVYGAYLEILYKEQLDHAFKVFRDKAQDNVQVDIKSRLHLLELIELRAKGWKGTDGMSSYYKKKMNQCSQQMDLMITSDSISNLSDSISSVLTMNSQTLAPGEVLKPSGKFMKPTRIPGKKYCKDEVVIRNADSGKVSPGAKERLVQITGANEESINHAKQLIEDTIRRNASPVREGGSAIGGPLTGSSSSINSSVSDESPVPLRMRDSRALKHSMSTPDANLNEYTYTVNINGHNVKIIGDNLDLVRTSKLVLDEYFSGEPMHDMAQFYSFDSLPQPISQNDIEAAHSPTVSSSPVLNGQPAPSESPKLETDKGAAKLRKPRISAEDLCKPLNSPKTPTTATASHFDFKANSPAKILNYSIEVLAQLAMSPLCLTEPEEWMQILQEYPMLVRKTVQGFDAKQYLSIRTEEPSGLINAEDISDD